MKNRSKLIGYIIGIFLFICVIGGVTFAWYRKTIYNVNVVGVTKNLEDYITYSSGSVTQSTLTPTDDYTEGSSTTITLYKKDSPYDNIYGHIYIDINTMSTDLSKELRYTVVNNTTSAVVGEGLFYPYAEGNSVPAAYNMDLSSTATTYTIYIWIDEDLHDSNLNSSSLDIDIRCSATLVEIPSITAAEYITLLYTSAAKSTATVNSITYNLASSENLMNDRHASTSVNIDAGDIRYYGSSPKNYIYFNCSDYSNQSSSTCEKWRIIGVFDGKLKIIRNESIGSYSWDTTYKGTGGSADKYSTNEHDNVSAMLLNNTIQKDKNNNTKVEQLAVEPLPGAAVATNEGWGINQWGPSPVDGSDYEGADLMKLLNPGYEENVDYDNTNNVITVNNSLYWNSGSGNCYTTARDQYTACSFTTSGLKNSTTKNMIYDATWYLGAYEGYPSYVDTMYNAERQSVKLGKICSSGNGCNDNVQRTSSWNGKVGLIYPSDYGYATDLSLCSSTLYNYNNATCYTNNWLHQGTQWTITPTASSGAYYVYGVGSNGTVIWNFAYTPNYLVRPVVYLNSSVLIDTVGKDGSEAHPYEITLD